MQTIDSLNDEFGMAGRVTFSAGPNDFPLATLTSPFGSAELSVYGGHVLSYQPAGHAPVLWLSQLAEYLPGKAIRGGIPVIWPWFGAHPTDAGKPSHGFARRQFWRVTGSESDGLATAVTLALQPTPISAEIWPEPFLLELTVTLGPVLDVALTATNLATTAVTTTAALHSYFAISDIDMVLLAGLNGLPFVDQLDQMAIKKEQRAVTFTAEVDRIYLDTATTSAEIVDPGLERVIRVTGRGSNSTVVWNPWVDKAARMADFGDAEYRSMLCVETANAHTDAISLAPGASHELAAVIEVEFL